MGTLKRIAESLEAIRSHLYILDCKMERIAVALEPSQRTELNNAIAKSKAEKPRRRRTKKYPGLVGLEPWRQAHGLSGYSKITAFCDKQGIAVMSIKGHPYINEADLPKIETEFAK